MKDLTSCTVHHAVGAPGGLTAAHAPADALPWMAASVQAAARRWRARCSACLDQCSCNIRAMEHTHWHTTADQGGALGLWAAPRLLGQLLLYPPLRPSLGTHACSYLFLPEHHTNEQGHLTGHKTTYLDNANLGAYPTAAGTMTVTASAL